MASVSASLTVKVSKSDDQNVGVSAEVDTREDGLNAGKTNFQPGDMLYFLVWASAGLNVEVFSNVDHLSKSRIEGSASYDHDEGLAFDTHDSLSASLSKPSSSALTVSWMGQNLGSVALQDDLQTVRIPDPGLVNGQKQARRVGVARVKYSSTPQVWALSLPAAVDGASEYDVNIVIVGVES